MFPISPSEHCDEPHCAKQCFALEHFDWCLEHSAPSVEDIHGTYHITEVLITKIEGQVVKKQQIGEKRRCAVAKEEEIEDPDCNVVRSGVFLSTDSTVRAYVSLLIATSDFMDPSELHDFEMDRWMAEQMAKDSP